MLRKFCLALGPLFLLAACGPNNPIGTTESSTKKIDSLSIDSHTQSNADSIQISHLDLDIQVSMQNKQITGCALWTIKNSNKLKELKLDTHELTIDSVTVDGVKVNHSMGQLVPHLGTALHVPVSEGSQKVAVWYKTGAHPRALQWLEPAQTHDKKYPFLYTQSEAIYGRSWLPCPDGPGIRYSYNARVTVPKGLLALMSAENPQTLNDSSIYHFRMDVPVPAYLMALAVGNITFKKIDDRTGVYAEPGMIDKVRYEYEDVGKMVTTAEGIYGKYQWGRYDVLVLPPGFPIGGMENPRLTFCTPTVIAGDRSLVSLIAHELAHSWSGNLVTNATWHDFWLNEGFTDYFERRIMEKMSGKDYADMLWELGYEDLRVELDNLKDQPRDTWLKLDLRGRDPDDGLTDIPYEKGSHFLKLIENCVGREKFDVFLNAYFSSHAFKTITTEQFLDYLDKNLIKGDTALRNKIDVQHWVYGPGVPETCPRADNVRFGKVDAERAEFLKGKAPAQLATKEWSTHEWLHFLRKMPETLSMAQMKSLDNTFHFTRSGNCEIADLWFIMSIHNKYETAYPAMERFLSSVGRRKFIEPIYKELMHIKDGGPETARKLFEKYRNNYHPIAQESLEKILGAGK